MTQHTASMAHAWLRSLHARVLAAVLCFYAVGTSATGIESTPPSAGFVTATQNGGMSFAPALTQSLVADADRNLSPLLPASRLALQNVPDAYSALPPTHLDENATAPLRLEHVLSSLGLMEPGPDDAGALAHSPSWSSILKFLYWFALLLLISLSLRDTLGLFRHLLSRPPAPRPSMPYAPWPSMTVIFESHFSDHIASNLAALAKVDYPAERLKTVVLCPLHEPDVFEAVRTAKDIMPGRVVAMQAGDDGDVAGRCFSAGIRFGTGELVMVLSDTAPCPAGAIKACAERFFDPSLGALLGFLPGAAAGDKALAPRMAKLLRIASQTAGMTAAAGMTPGTGLLALRRSAVRTVGMNASRANDCFALLRQLERFGSLHSVQEGVVAAGEAVHNWDGRSRWMGACARAFAATMPINPLRWLGQRHAAPANFGMRGKLVLPALWSLVALGSIVLYFTGNAMAAAMGLTVCTATASTLR